MNQETTDEHDQIISKDAWSIRVPIIHSNKLMSNRTNKPTINSRADMGLMEIKGSSSSDYSYHPRQSSAMTRIKACAALKDKDAVDYMKKFSTSRYTAKSAHSHKRGTSNTAILGVNAGYKLNRDISKTLNDESIKIWRDIAGGFAIGDSNTKDKKEKHVQKNQDDMYIDIQTAKTHKALLEEMERQQLISKRTISSAYKSQHPIGAHSSGFYSKHNYQLPKSKPASAKSTGKQRPNLKIPSTQKIITYDLQINQEKLDKEDENIRESFQAQNIDHLLCILADEHSFVDEIHNSLIKLIDALSDNLSSASDMYDRGAVIIVLNLMENFSLYSSIQKDACKLLLLMAKNNPLTLASLYEQNGIMTILKATQVICADDVHVPEKRRGSMQPELRPNKWKSTAPNNRVTIIDSNSNLNSSLINDHRSIQSSFMDLSRFLYLGTTEDSLIAGLLKKYFDPKFLSQWDKMDKTKTFDSFTHLLRIFEKVDRFLSLSSCISLDTDLQRAIDQIVFQTSNILECELIQIYLVDPETGELIAINQDEWMLDATQRALLPETRFPPGSGIAGLVALTSESVSTSDAMSHEKFDEMIDIRGHDMLAVSLICSPIKNRDGAVKGVLEAINKVNSDGNIQNFTDEDKFFLETLAKQAGAMIHDSQVYDQMKTTQKKVEVLLETTRSLGSTLELDLLVKMIMDAAKELLSADRCTLFLIDSQGKFLRAQIQGRDLIQEIRIPVSSGIAGLTFTSGASVNIPDAYKDSRFNPEVDRQTGYVTRNILCMPIKNISGECIGVTQMINKKKGRFGLDDEKMLSSFSAQAAVAIEKSYLFKKTEDMLRETSQMKNYLSMILQSITNVVMTLNGDGRLSHINHPSKIDMTETRLNDAKSKYYEEWLSGNHNFISDIQKAYNNPGGTIFAQDYELNLFGKVHNVNYTIVQMTGESSSVSKFTRSYLEGVVIVLEDISSEKRALMTLGRYMSPALAQQVMKEDGGQLGGKRKKVAILFSDIRSFTTLSESMEPHEVVELLNHHFSDAVNAILAEQGILDKYIGDAVMAVFGVPFVNVEDSIHACNAALRMKESVEITNEGRIKAGLKPIKIGIGVNTGMVLSGNIGSTKRMEFSCIGDSVNLASRIEGLTKHYQLTILVTNFTLQETGDAFISREIDEVVVTGKSNKVTIYEILARKGEYLPDNVLDAMASYEKGLQKYRRKQFSGAIKCFEEAIKASDDGPSKTLKARCQYYMANPPPEDWSGIYHSDSK